MKGVISVVNNSANTREFKDLGVRVVSPAFSTLMVLENLVIHPAAFSLLTEGEDNLLVEEAVLANAAYVKKRLRDIRLPGDTLIMSVSRNGENIIPHGNTVLERGDHVCRQQGCGTKDNGLNRTLVLPCIFGPEGVYNSTN